ncbi:MAG: small ribosomal subunit biogenesis GTPase RsgA [Wenzhouxiangellaceae bacterium]
MIPARVLVSYGSHGIVSTGEAIYDCKWRRGTGRPLCGDQVQIQIDRGGNAALNAIQPRASEFKRGDNRGRAQPIAANVDQVIIVIAPKPAPSAFLIDRYLVAIKDMGLPAIVVVNKYDLSDDASHCSGDTLLQRLEVYAHLQLPTITTSTKQNPPGIDALASCLRDRVSILVGQSGVGKSSLINAMIPDREEQTGALSDATGKGRHTTTRTAWIKLPEGGAVIDSPGVWEYGLWHMPAAAIAERFPDFEPYLGCCRFRDCSHRHEPGCALRQAISAGQLPQHRLDAYHNILDMQQQQGYDEGMENIRKTRK